VCEATSLAPGGVVRCELAGREILVCNVAGELHAVSGRCSHAAWSLGPEDLAGFRLTCSLHGARFDVRDGSVLTGPARKPLDRYPVRIRDGRVEVEIPLEPPKTGGDGRRRVP
jgi:3-phenylpropionate/trans-cinnamate dioxygenase ferredoxin subunit